MGELSFLTIIVSLAVCSLLVYAAFQYMKVRLSILEQSHKEQAMILQQYIEESSTDIHRLYQMSTSGRGDSFQQNGSGSIILEYANENVSEKPVAYHEPHTIHLDTALYQQNKRSSNLIEISSDSEDTTDSECESTSDSESDATSESDNESEASAESDRDNDDSNNALDVEIDEYEVGPVVSEIVDLNETVNPTQSAEIKLVTVDLGTIQEQDVKPSTDKPLDVLSMLYKKAQQTPLPDDVFDAIDAIDVIDASVESSQASVSTPEPTAPVVTVGSGSVPLSGMSVTELKFLLKEKYKNNPEKHAEIQKLKKAELIHALQQIQ
jgi:hypothetical protein